MNEAFTQAVERAFELGLESRAAAAATVRVNSLLNGSQRRAEEAAIEAGWGQLCSNKGDVSFSEIVAFVRERCPNIELARVREEFRWRFRERGVGW